MKIFGSDSGFFKKDRVGDTGKSGKADKASSESSSDAKGVGSSSSGGDTLSVSSFAKEVAKVSEAVKSAPDVRTERVSEIKAQVDAGSYNVPADKIAGKIIDDILSQGK